MNTPGNKQFPETFADKIHKEEYENRVVFELREDRLKELGYTGVITVKSPRGATPQTPEEQTEDAINILLEEKREVVMIVCGRTVKLYQRAPGSNLPTAKEDFDSPAVDAVIAYAVDCIRTGMKKNLN